jgi:hypothetical protein
MIDNNDDIQQRNIDLLIVGYWYEDLPPIIDIANMKEKIKGIVKNIDNDMYDDFYKADGIITEYNNTQAPSYIFNDGIEPITFFEFKKNGALREMQIPNLKYYVHLFTIQLLFMMNCSVNCIMNRNLINMFVIQIPIYYLMSCFIFINCMMGARKLLRVEYLL